MLKHKKLSDAILASYYEVYNTLGHGFLEKVYQNALFFELCNRGLKVEAQVKISVLFKERLVGEYFADMVVEDKIILELKAETALHPAHDK